MEACIGWDKPLGNSSESSISLNQDEQNVEFSFLELSHIQNEKNQRVLFLVTRAADASNEEIKEQVIDRLSDVR